MMSLMRSRHRIVIFTYNYQVSNCYIYQAYDAGVTHQVTTWGKKRVMSNVLYKDNLIEKCVYSIEYFLEMNNGDTRFQV